MANPRNAGRKGYGEELRIKESLAEITPLMFEFVKEVMTDPDYSKTDKMNVVTKILPKIVDKAMPTELNIPNAITIKWEDNGNNNSLQAKKDSE